MRPSSQQTGRENDGLTSSPAGGLEQGISRREVISAGAGLAVTLGVIGCGGGGKTSTTKSTTTAQGPPKRGGILRVGMTGGGSTETLNPNKAAGSDVDIARSFALYDWLVYPTPKGPPKLHLAESMEKNADATVWTIRLRSGVKWHDGKPLTANDLMYTLRYVDNVKTGSINYLLTQLMDLKQMKKLDDLTVRVPLKIAIASFLELLCDNAFGVMPDGTTSFEHPIGTGPFKFDSWKPGTSSRFLRNPDYWIEGKPYVDELQILSIPDTSARLNALLGGQVHAASQLGYAQAKQYQAQGASAPINVLVGEGPGFVGITMGFIAKPFSDANVRKAFRLIVDRKAMVEQVQSGFGKVANDMYGLGFPLYDTELPQREQDIEQAKSLLKKAGYEGLKVTLPSSRALSGQLESATLFAQQASAAGVTVNVRNTPAGTYFSTGYPNYPFGQTTWQAIQIPYFYITSLLPGAPYNETQWKDPLNTKLIHAALADPDPSGAQEKWNAVQKYGYDNGGELLWGTSPWVDGLSKKVGGAYPSAFFNFSGVTLRDWWLK